MSGDESPTRGRSAVIGPFLATAPMLQLVRGGNAA